MHEIDEIDKTIIRCLIKDARMSFTDIGKKCSISSAAIKKRYNRLKEMEIIGSSTGIVNIRKIGYSCYLSLYVLVKNEMIDDFIDYTYSFTGVMTAKCKFNKEYNVHVLLPLRNTDEIELKKAQIINHPALIRMSVNIWTEIISLPENVSLEYM